MRHRHKKRASSAFVAVSALAYACGGDVGDADGRDAGPGADAAPPDGDLEAIRVEPENETLVVTPGEPAELDYRAIGEYDDGSEVDLTDEVLFSLENSRIGGFEGPRFESVAHRGGETEVLARQSGVTGRATLSVVFQARHDDPATGDDLPDDPGSALDGDEDEDRAPELVYPNDGTLVPPNLRDLEIHFLPGEGNDLYELTFENAVTEISVYLRCGEEVGGGCVYQPDEDLWIWLAETNRGAETVEVGLRATDADDEDAGVGVAEPIDLNFSLDEVRGTIFYWTTSGDTAIMRYDFGASDEVAAEPVLEPSDVDEQTSAEDTDCVGCHALSPDGTKMVSELEGQRDGRLVLFDLLGDSIEGDVTEREQSIFQTWSPDSSEFVGVYMDSGSDEYNLRVFDGETMERTGTIDVGASESEPANHPDWSPDGDEIVFNSVGEPFKDDGRRATNQRSHHGQIERIVYEGDSADGWDPEAWSEPEVLVPREDETNYYYPAYAPDPDYLIFNRSRCEDGNIGPTHECDGDMNPTAELLMMPAEPGAEPVELESANAPGVMDDGDYELYNSFPKWSPFEFQRTEEVGSRLFWVAFSSKRMAGLREPVGDNALLWMAAVDPERLDEEEDPSFPAFAIPYQEFDTDNHIPQWTQSTVVIE